MRSRYSFATAEYSKRFQLMEEQLQSVFILPRASDCRFQSTYQFNLNYGCMFI